MKHKFKITLVGSPNVGKSVLFGKLTGIYATVSNYPGTTVDVSRGSVTIGGLECEVIDTPGLYSLFPASEEEKVALRILYDEKPDLILNVLDAKNIERMLPLALQIKEAGFNSMLVLNMFDEAASKGFTIDTNKLAERTGIPVLATVAVTGGGISQLLRSIEAFFNEAVESAKRECRELEYSDKKMIAWYEQARKLLNGVVIKKKEPYKLSRLDRMILSPWLGFPILALILYLGLYKFVGQLGAGIVVDWLDTQYEATVNPFLISVSQKGIPWEWLRTLFVGDFGILTFGFRYAISIILPVVGFFFIVFAILEDSGYLPRLAFLLDRAFKRIGLSGRAVIPMVLGLGCDTMATVVTRTLPTSRERFISTMLLTLCIPCSAQLGVILGLLSKTPKILFAWLGIILLVFVLAGTLLSLLVPGALPSFILEIPPLRLPQFRNVIQKTYMRLEWYFKEIVPLFIIASVLIWFGELSGMFQAALRYLSVPLSWMGLPEGAAPAFLFGFFRRDYGAAGLFDLAGSGGLTDRQMLIAVVVMTLFLPCVTQFLVNLKERGFKMGIFISVFVLLVAFSVGMLLNVML